MVRDTIGRRIGRYFSSVLFLLIGSLLFPVSTFAGNSSVALLEKSNITIAAGEVFDLSEETAASEVFALDAGTIVIRYQSGSMNQYQSLFSVSNSATGNENRHFHIYVTPTGTLGMELRNTDGDFKYTMAAVNAIQPDSENVIAFSADPATGTYKLFANGVCVASLTKENYKFFSDIDSLNSIALGGTVRGGVVRYPFEGEISDFKLYADVLDDTTLEEATRIPDVESTSENDNQEVLLSKTDLNISDGSVFDLTEDAQAENIRTMTKGTVIVRYTSTSSNGLQSLFSVSNSTVGNENRHFHVYITPGGYLGFELRNTDGEFKYTAGRASAVRSTYNGEAAENTIAFVADREAKTYKLFANGQFISKLQVSDYKFISDITGTDTVSLGATIRGGVVRYPFGGTIQSVTVTDAVYSDEELEGLTAENSYGTLIFSDKDTTQSNYFRIPSLLTLTDGTVVAAADARYGGTHDSKSNIDTAFSYSKDNGATWADPILSMEFEDYAGQRVEWPTSLSGRNLQISGSASFIDPSMVQDKTNGRLFLFADVMPAGIGSSNAAIGNGYKEVDGKSYLKLRWYEDASSAYNYSVRENGVIYNDVIGEPTEYSVNPNFEILKNGRPLTVKQYIVNISGTTLQETKTDTDVAMNVFYKDACFKVYPTTYLGMKFSDDGGKTWSSLQLLNTLKSDAEKILVTGPGTGVQIQNGDYAGRLVVPVYSITKAGFGVIYSDDGGDGWQYAAADSFSSGSTAEAQIIEMPDGSLKAFVRTSSRHIAERTSIDGGVTWTAEKSLTNVTCTSYGTQLSVIKYTGQIDGKEAVIMSTPNSGSGRNTGVINIGLITDTGGEGAGRYSVDWTYSYQLNGTGGFSYSCLSELADGTIGILYEGYDSWSREQLHLKNILRFEKYSIDMLRR